MKLQKLIGLVSGLMILSALFIAMPVSAETVATSPYIVPNAALPDNAELFAGYVDKTFYPDNTISLFGVSAKAQLSEPNQKLYEFLKEQIEKVAKGELASTVFTADAKTLATWNVKTTWTRDKLGVESIDGDWLFEAFWSQFDYAKVINALVHDCPYDCYWFDKTVGVGTGSAISLESEEKSSEDAELKYISGTVKSMIFSFPVAPGYQASNFDPDNPEVATAKTGATTTTVNNAKAIVDANQDLSDYEKLCAYRDKICSLVSYNFDVISNDYAGGYTDPWQLIYVFDNDPTTNVVCEGYSKAFQYLCDLSSFTNDITCYTVTGTMIGGSGAGNHMWNIVTMEDGKNYLVDITNSDSGTIGTQGGLFLAGTAGTIPGGYVFTIVSYYITFCYDNYTIPLWGTGTDSILNLAASDYVGVLGGFADILSIQKAHENDGTVTLTITPKPDKELPAMKCYTVIYDSNGILKDVQFPLCQPENGKVTISIAEPLISNGEAYHLMLWTTAQIPIIKSIGSENGFFQ